MAEMLQRALAHHQRGELAQARALYLAILEREPRHFDALKLLGTLAMQVGDLPGAVRLLTQALDVRPADATALNNRAVAFKELGHFEAALQDCEQAIRLDAAYPQAHDNRGIALRALGRFEASLASHDTAIALAPGDAGAHNNRGVVLCDLDRPAQALASFDEALRLAPANADAWCNRGNALQALGRPDEALASYVEATRLKPAYAEAFNNQGVVHHDHGRLQEAMACFQQASMLDLGYADAWWNQSLVLLLRGELELGWPLYEWRRQAKATRAQHPALPAPLWTGSADVAGRTVLLRAEQGLGDTIQFCRYATLVAKRGARVVLEVPQALAGLMRGLEGVAEVVVHGQPLPPFDFHGALMSMPLAFGTTLASIPAPARYLAAEPAKLALWSGVLGERQRPRVGLVWSGRTTHRMDRERSLPLARLLRALPDAFEYVSLQKELREEDRAAASGVRHFGESIVDFTDTAALCELVDFVVSVDTSVAHLAAALGRPTHVLLAAVPDWRWMLDRADSPWYPTVRLWRQDASRDWSPVLAGLAVSIAAGG